jgi:hypothetical protein
VGAARYRITQYAESLSTMMRAEELRHEPDANDLVFIAMAHHHRGHRDEARAALVRVRTMHVTGQWKRGFADDDLQAHFDDATALIGR